MDENTYLQIKEQLLRLHKDDIVRVFDDAFLERWKKYMAEERGRLLAEAFSLPLLACWFLWYIFQEMSHTDLMHLSLAAIVFCACVHYALTVRQHKEWVHDDFTHYCADDTAKKCLLVCKASMTEKATSREKQDLLAQFFLIAENDPHIGSSMHRVWLCNTKKIR